MRRSLWIWTPLGAGRDFVEAIGKAVDSCAVLVALIGRQWATLTGEDGRRRLDNPDDFVRFEVKTALKRGVPVIPVLVDSAKPPRQEDLPDDLHKLARLNALELSVGRHQHDTDRLLDLIQQELVALREEADRKAREEEQRKARQEADRKAREEQRKAQPEILFECRARKRTLTAELSAHLTITTAGISFAVSDDKYSFTIPASQLKRAKIREPLNLGAMSTPRTPPRDLIVKLGSGQKYRIELYSWNDKERAKEAISRLLA
jgi:hypothetical protein